MPIVTSKEQAMNWFLAHSDGSVNCRRADGAEKVVDCYPDAVAFFDEGS